MSKKFSLKKVNPTIQPTVKRTPLREIEAFFKGEEKTDLQKYSYTFVLKKREK